MKNTMFLKKYIAFCLVAFSIISCSKSPQALQKRELKVDVKKRFIIAHAGGKIDGFIYTNSLEALNSSYKKGCLLFELDIQETSDGKLIAVHDWEEFKKITNYQGEKNRRYSTDRAGSFKLENLRSVYPAEYANDKPMV
jgi:glycerophosphoryl diester phosphodiesterase